MGIGVSSNRGSSGELAISPKPDLLEKEQAKGLPGTSQMLFPHLGAPAWLWPTLNQAESVFTHSLD